MPRSDPNPPPDLPFGRTGCAILGCVQPLTIKDPRGVVWKMALTREIVRTENLERAVERSGMTDHQKRKRRRGLGIKELPFAPGLFEGYRWRVGWGRDHSFAWIVHAVSQGEHRAWLSPALSRKAALADLDQIAAQIQLGEEPAPSHP